MTDGIYAVSSPIRIGKRITLRSVSGPERTVVTANNRCTCFSLEHRNAVIRGFTIARGRATSGGGIYFKGGLAENCIITRNRAREFGGGAYLAGGGALRNCLITRNSAIAAAGIYCSTNTSVESCTIAANSATALGGGVVCARDSRVRNSIIYFNTARIGANAVMGVRSQYSYCCSQPRLAGTGNVSGTPLFIDAPSDDFRLDEGSPCVNAGANQPWMVSGVDLDEMPRIAGEATDMGAYEQPAE